MHQASVWVYPQRSLLAGSMRWSRTEDQQSQPAGRTTAPIRPKSKCIVSTVCYRTLPSSCKRLRPSHPK
jgi:hypothetical protein